MQPKDLFFYASAIVGTIAFLTVAYVFTKRKDVGMIGFVMLFCGTVLIGLPVWSNAKISWDKEGFLMQFEAMKKEVAAAKQRESEYTNTIASLTSDLKITQDQFKTSENESNGALLVEISKLREENQRLKAGSKSELTK